ncbi:MAG TPA: sigma-54-dependent Fis family transcriptional regulator [Minicystis sp.]|nr:sigma-54-dependent Fis family transcriptional regulator [Minicystis sp.]
MDRYASLLEIAKLLLAADGETRAAQAILERVFALCDAERGFIVVRKGDGFDVALDIAFDRASVSKEERRFSRSLVRRALESRQAILSQSLADDPRFSEDESIARIGSRSVLVVPLSSGDETYGAVYLDRDKARGGIPEDASRFVQDFAELAGLVLRRALEHDELARRAAKLEHDLLARCDFQGIVTQDARMIEVLRLVAQVAESDATVLVLGETGTGKELIARALHANSKRAAGPFVALHCAALPPTILEAELFGHTRGAFTGAERERAGRLGSADGGTLFLDEVAEIPPDVQAKILRFLQFGEIQRPGSDKIVHVDARVVAATHRDLEQMVAAGTFRQDLYYRLKLIEITLPPLRDRLGDVPLLVDAILRERRSKDKRALRFTDEALARLGRYAYPGNVRELRHLVERACVLATGPTLGVDLLPAELRAAADEPTPEGEAAEGGELERVKTSAERAYLEQLLARSGGNISKAARESGIHRSQLQRLLSRHGLRSG